MIVSNLRTAFALLFSVIVLTGILYPLFITLIGQFLFHKAANGSLIIDKGKIKGSELIGQPFTDPKFFWSRPSSTTPYPYNAIKSSGSNFGELNPDYLKAVKDV